MSSISLEQHGLSNLVEAATALATFSQSSRVPVISPEQSKHTYSGSSVTTSNSKPYVHGERLNNQTLTNISTAPIEVCKETFPQRLLVILNDADVSSDVISWLPNGCSFIIARPDIFMESILPKYIAPDSNRNSAPTVTSLSSLTTISTKYPSFTRKLNRWGFRQITRGPETGSFHHELFRREQPELCLQMFCQRSKSCPSTKKPPKENTGSIRKDIVVSNPPIKKRRVSSLTKESLDVMNQEQDLSTAFVSNIQTGSQPVTISEDSQSMRSSGSGGKKPSSPTFSGLQQLLSGSGSSCSGITNNPVLVHRAITKRNEEERMRLAKVMLYSSFLQAMNGDDN